MGSTDFHTPQASVLAPKEDSLGPSVSPSLSAEDHIVIALYDFTCTSERDLEMVKGEKLQVLSW